MTGNSVRIGTLFGIPIRIHLSFLIVLPFLAFEFGRVYSDAARAAEVPPERLTGSPFFWGLVVALALFASVLVHELAHSLYALRRGGRVRGITLLMIGGVSQISEPPRGGRNEAVMALVGPATSLALGGVFFVLFHLVAGAGLFDLKFALFQLMSLNLVLGVFNLLPAFPMDGGRVLRGALADRWGLLRATRVAAAAGKAFALLFAIVGFLTANLLLIVVAFFVWVGADAESRGVLVKAMLGHVRVRDLMSSMTSSVESSASAFDVAERMLREGRTAFPVVEGASVLGIVALEDVQRVPAEERGRTPIAPIVRRVSPLESDEDAPRALRVLGDARVPVVPVVDHGALVGVLSQTDLLRGLQLTELEASQHPGEAAWRGPAVRRTEQHA